MEGGEATKYGARARLAGATGAVVAMTALSAWLLLSAPAMSAGPSGGAALLPDLIVEPPEEIILQKSSGSNETYLRFSHTTSNVGQGPLEIYPDLESEDCDDRGDRALLANQLVYGDTNSNGVFQRNVDTDTSNRPVGCMIFHAIHNHYHFEDFALYELYRVSSGALKETSDKVSFCVVDILNTHPGLPGEPDDPYYGFANCDQESGVHGISVGYADIYGSGTPGQEFDVSDRRPGRYCLVAYTDPADRLDEVAAGGEDNNVQTVQIKVNKRHATEFGKQVPIIDEPCSPPAP